MGQLTVDRILLSVHPMRNLMCDVRGQASTSFVLLTVFIGLMGISSFSSLGEATAMNLRGAVDASPSHLLEGPTMAGRAQAAVTSAARAAYRATRSVTDAIADAGKLVDAAESSRLIDLVSDLKRLADDAGYVAVLRIADESADSPLAATLLKRDHIELVDGSLSTRQFDIVSLDQAMRPAPERGPIRVLPEEDGHYLMGLSEGKVPDLQNSRVQQDLIRTSLLTSLDRLHILDEESAARIARRLAAAGEGDEVELFAQYRPRYGPWAPENVVDGAFNNQGSRVKIKPQLTTAIAEGSGMDMNAYSATGGNSRPHLALGSYADTDGLLSSTALMEKVVWHELKHADTDGIRPEYRYPGVLDTSDAVYAFENIPDFHVRHPRGHTPKSMPMQELATRLFFSRVLHEGRSDFGSMIGATHDPAMLAKFIEVTDGNMRIRQNNPLREVGVRFARDMGVKKGGLRAQNPAETLEQAMKLQQGRAQANPYDFAVVVKRWLEDGLVEHFEQKLLELAETADDLEDATLIKRAMEAAADDLNDLERYVILHEGMDGGPDLGRYAMLMVKAAQEGKVLDGPAPDLAQVLFQSALERGFIMAQRTEEGIAVQSATEFAAFSEGFFNAMTGTRTHAETFHALREAAAMHDHHLPIQ